MPSQTRKILFSLLLGLSVLIGGSAGYMIIEGWSFLDSIYMIIITVATVGYGEIKPLSPSGRILTIFIIIFGAGSAAYLIGQLTRAMVEGSVQRALGRRMLESQIRKLKDHYIICGYGRIGRMISKEINAKHHPLIVLENDETVRPLLEKDGQLYIWGDASDEDNLTAAGIERAVGLISAVSSDADNLYIVLTARSLNPNLFILSRASQERSLKKLLGAGADRVISPYLIGARKMAQALLRPAVADFLESTVHGTGLNLAMEEILITPTSQLKDVTLMESNIRRDLDLIIIAIKTGDGEMVFNPSAQTKICIGDTLIAVGKRENMDQLVHLVGADTSAAPRYSRLKKGDLNNSPT